MSQLFLWQQCNYDVEIESNRLYQRWLYNAEVELNAAIGRAPDRLRFEDEEKAKDIGKAGTSNQEVPATKAMRCRKCRALLGMQEYFVAHDPKNPTAPKSHSEYDMSFMPLPNPEAGDISATSVACGHYFLEPLSWMRPALETGELEGRLLCPNTRCESLVGRWNWKGLRCSCGLWVTPAFAVQKGRVDLLSPVVERGKGAQAANMRMPPGARMPPVRDGNL